jgi:anti-sigma B factor antagonist
MQLPDLEFGVRSADAGDGVYVVGVRGELDLHTAPELDLELRELLERGALWLIVDLAAVTFVDSTSLGVLAAATRSAVARDGALVLVTDRPSTIKALTITGLDRLIPLRRTLGEALVEAEHSARREVA